MTPDTTVDESLGDRGQSPATGETLLRPRKSAAQMRHGENMDYLREEKKADESMGVPTSRSMEEEASKEQARRSYDDHLIELDIDAYLNTTETMSQLGSTAVGSFDHASVVSAKSYRTSLTAGTNHTQSTRTLRPGQAKVRIEKEKRKKSTKPTGWQESIQAAAARTGRTWDPEHGWKDYVDPKTVGTEDEMDVQSTDRIHVPVDRFKKSSTENSIQDYVSTPPGSPVRVPFPPEWDEERSGMLREEDAGRERALAPPRPPVTPSRRNKNPKVVSPARDDKPRGWVETMKVATANIHADGKRWDPERGWIGLDEKELSVQGTDVGSLEDKDRAYMEHVTMISESDTQDFGTTSDVRAMPPVPVTPSGSPQDHREPTMEQLEAIADKNQDSGLQFLSEDEEQTTEDDISASKSMETKSVGRYMQIKETGSVQSHYRTPTKQQPNPQQQQDAIPEHEVADLSRSMMSNATTPGTKQMLERMEEAQNEAQYGKMSAMSVQRQGLGEQDAYLFPKRESSSTVPETTYDDTERSAGPIDLDEVYEEEMGEPQEDEKEEIVVQKARAIQKHGVSAARTQDRNDMLPHEKNGNGTPDMYKRGLSNSNGHKVRGTYQEEMINMYKNEARSMHWHEAHDSNEHEGDDSFAPNPDFSWDEEDETDPQPLKHRPVPRLKISIRDPSSVKSGLNSTRSGGTSEVSFESQSTSSRSIPKLAGPKRDSSPIHARKRTSGSNNSAQSSEYKTDLPLSPPGIVKQYEDDDNRMLDREFKQRGVDCGSNPESGERSPDDRGLENGADSQRSNRAVDAEQPHATTQHSSKRLEDESPASVKDLHDYWESRSTTPPDAQSAEWKSFLAKKVRAEAAAAAIKKERHKASADDEKDTTFDFNDSEGAFPTPTRNMPRGSNRKPGEPREGAFEDIDDLSPIRHDESDSDYAPSEASTQIATGTTFLQRLQACASPMVTKGTSASCGSNVPMSAHLAFLRNNPTVGGASDKPTNGNSGKFYPTPNWCGRPDVIVEEDEDEEDNDEKRAGTETKPPSAPSVAKSRSRSNPRSRQKDDVSSVISDEFGAKTAYFEALAMKAAVSGGSKKKKKRSPGSDVSSSSGSKHSEKFQQFLDRRASKSNDSQSQMPDKKPPTGRPEVSSRAEKYAEERMNEMMEAMAERSNAGVPLDYRGRPMHEETGAFPTVPRTNLNKTGAFSGNHHDASRMAAEDLAAARMEAMMQNLSGRHLDEEEGEI
mmetsp:Transcript_19707/g.35515  ORF Transcript_19707/g.35515 Transcript_19707/m.35515 type:complete len:1232 (-) Transcript_19707:194-3889(-)